MPAPGSATRSRWASSSTARGRNGRTGRKIVDSLFHRFTSLRGKDLSDNHDTTSGNPEIPPPVGPQGRGTFQRTTQISIAHRPDDDQKRLGFSRRAGIRTAGGDVPLRDGSHYLEDSLMGLAVRQFCGFPSFLPGSYPHQTGKDGPSPAIRPVYRKPRSADSPPATRSWRQPGLSLLALFRGFLPDCSVLHDGNYVCSAPPTRGHWLSDPLPPTEGPPEHSLRPRQCVPPSSPLLFPSCRESRRLSEGRLPE